MAITDRKAEVCIYDKYMVFEKNQILEICELNNLKYAFAYHDKDITQSGTPKDNHWHILVKSINPKPFETFANYFGVSPQNVAKVHKWSSALAYLTHKGFPEKYQYEDSDVITNIDIKKEIVSSRNVKRLSEIIQKIDTMEIRQYNLETSITTLEYTQFARQIKNAFEFVLAREVKKMETKKINVLYFFGETGTGKTLFAREYANKRNKSICISSSSNDILQDYAGQDILLLDDLRQDALTFADLLKLTDNYTNTSTTKSRYKNKPFIGDTIIITSCVAPQYLYTDIHEAVNQFLRRLNLVMEFTREKIYEWGYYKKDNRMVRGCFIDNFILQRGYMLTQPISFNDFMQEFSPPQQLPIPDLDAPLPFSE